MSKNGAAVGPYEESEGRFLAVKFLILRGNKDFARTLLEQLLDSEVNGYDDDDVYCHCCTQRHGESVELSKCAGCKVKYYCNRSHQKEKWRGRFIDHKMLCPYLNRWRRAKRRMERGKRSRDSLDSILNDFLALIENLLRGRIQKTAMAAVLERD